MRDLFNMILSLVGLGFSCAALTSEINGNPEHPWLIFLNLLCFAGKHPVRAQLMDKACEMVM